jgi:hypothetical protein
VATGFDDECPCQHPFAVAPKHFGKFRVRGILGRTQQAQIENCAALSIQGKRFGRNPCLW